jgi:hypothetical protein
MSLGVGVFDVRPGILERLQNFRAKPGIIGVAVADELQRQGALIRYAGLLEADLQAYAGIDVI